MSFYGEAKTIIYTTLKTYELLVDLTRPRHTQSWAQSVFSPTVLLIIISKMLMSSAYIFFNFTTNCRQFTI